MIVAIVVNFFIVGNTCLCWYRRLPAVDVGLLLVGWCGLLADVKGSVG